jgi:hypothetical protein
MKTRTTLLGGVVALSVMTGTGVYVAGAQASPQGAGTATTAPAAPVMTPDMAKMQEQMMARMHASDAKLDALVKTMDAAKGQAQVDAMAAVIRELVQSEKTTHGQMNDMRGYMMGHGEAAK